MKTTNELQDSLMSKKDLDSYLKNNTDSFLNKSFLDILNEYLDQKKMKRSELFRQANIYSRFGYEIFDGSKMPSRNNLIRICIAMKLTVKEADTLLYSCNHNKLYAKSPRDSIIIYSLANRYDVLRCNEELYNRQMELI